jgi:hypothetical protein
MSTFNGLPTHVLLVHFVVVLAPLTAILAILCAILPAVRQRLVWLVLVLALVTTALTPLTVEAGEWLAARIGSSPALETHAERGETMLYFALALLVAAILLVFVHLRPVSTAIRTIIASVVIAARAATIVAVIRIGDSGSHAVWGGVAVDAPASG